MTSNNLDFVARCMIGHNTKDIKSLTSDVEQIKEDIGGVKIVQITKEDYDALTDKPTNVIYLVSDGDKITLYIGGTEVNEIEGIKVNNTTINPDSNKVVNITVPTTAADVSALPDTTKYAAALSLTINSLTYVMTGQLKDQNGDNLGTAQTIDLPLESVVVGGSYNSQTKKVVLTLQNGNTIEFSVADLVSGLQTELSMSNKLNPAFIEYDSTHRAVSDTEKSTWNSKQNAIDSSHKLSADNVDDTNATNKFATAEELEQIQTNKNNISLVESSNGKKNLVNSASGSDTNWGVITISPEIPEGDYIVGFATLGGDYSGVSRISLYNGSTQVNTVQTDIPKGNNVYVPISVASGRTANAIRIYAKTEPASGVAVTWTTAFICKKSLWDISPTITPYAPTNAELYAMIQALQ